MTAGEAVTSPRSSNLFAHRCEHHGFKEFHSLRLGVEQMGAGEIIAVRVIEDHEGPLWGWWDNLHTDHSIIFPSWLAFNTCFEYGAKKAEERGDGVIVRLRVEPR